MSFSGKAMQSCSTSNVIFDLSMCWVFCKVWYLEKIYDLFPWTHSKLYLHPYVDLSALLHTTLLVTWKSTRAITCHAICEIYYTTKIPKFCITGGWWYHKKYVFQPLSSPHNFDTLMTSSVLENIFHSK